MGVAPASCVPAGAFIYQNGMEFFNGKKTSCETRRKHGDESSPMLWIILTGLATAGALACGGMLFEEKKKGSGAKG